MLQLGRILHTGTQNLFTSRNVITMKILYIDMDSVLVDFQSGIDRISPQLKAEYEDHLDDVPGIFSLMKPMPGAVEAFEKLAQAYDTYLSLIHI